MDDLQNSINKLLINEKFINKINKLKFLLC